MCVCVCLYVRAYLPVGGFDLVNTKHKHELKCEEDEDGDGDDDQIKYSKTGTTRLKEMRGERERY